MKQTKHFIFILLGVSLCLNIYGNNPDKNKTKIKSVSFRGIYADDPNGKEGLYNPERGLRLEIAVDIAKRKDVWNPERFSDITGHLRSESAIYASDSISLVQSYFYLTGFVGKSLTEDAFKTMDIYFNELRKSGKKAVLRFAYETDFMGRASAGPTLADVLRHMEQLKPYLAQNTDIIQVVQAGFIGAWGEWHGSLHGLENSDDSKRTILEKILWMTPENRMVQIRVPAYKNLISKEDKSYNRISFHDDFIIIKPHKWDGDMHEGTPYFKQIVEESPYLIVDGELPWGTWSMNEDPDNPEAGWIVDGKATARQLFLQHYTSLSAIHNYKERETTDKYSMMYWKETPIDESFLVKNRMPVSSNYFKNQDGSSAERSVFDYIRDHLGYRLELQQLNIEGAPSIGKKISFDLSLINRGFSTLFNEHPVYFVLIDQENQVTEFITDTDVNDFQPYNPDDKNCEPLLHHIKGEFTIPQNLAKGKYKLGLWIPDGSERLRYNKRYAIRCANGNMAWWSSPDNKYGVNILTTIDISSKEF